MSSNDKIEEFDDDGNVLRVANLEFIQGVLGQGAFGTVRLARRKLQSKTPPATPNTVNFTKRSSFGSGGGGYSASIPESLTLDNSDLKAVTAADDGMQGSGTPRRTSGYARSRRGNRALLKSASAPTTSDFFDTNTRALSSTMNPDFSNNRQGKSISFFPSTKPATGESSSGSRLKSSSVVGNLGLLTHAKSSIDHHEGHGDNDDDEQLVAVKIFSKSILKRQRTMERDKSTHRVKVKTALQQVEREIALMKKLSHPNLVNMYDVIDSPESDMLYMVLEYMPGGEILTYQNDGTFRRKDPRPTSKSRRKLDGLVDGHFDEDTAALYFVDILHGLAYLHQHHICHRDLKPENILLDGRNIANLGDFGVSHIFEQEKDFTFLPPGKDSGIFDDNNDGGSSGTALDDSNTRTSATSVTSHKENNEQGMVTPHTQEETIDNLPPPPPGTPNILSRREVDAALQMTGMARYGLLSRTEGTWCFWSPEMCEGRHAFSGYAADIWAAGVCLYIFVTGRLPFYSEVPTELFHQIAEAKIDFAGLGLSNGLVDLLKRALEKDPDKRAGVGDLLKHPFLELARDKRVKKLSSEFEISRKRKIVLSEEDVKAVRNILAATSRVQASFFQFVSSRTFHTQVLTTDIFCCDTFTGLSNCHECSGCLA
jgi:serine/threonine protein kinase